MARGPEAKRFIEGERLWLRDVRASDVAGAYYQWMNDLEVTRFLENRFFPHSEDSMRRYVETISRDPANTFFAIIRRADSSHIGTIKLGPINWVHRTGDVALMIGDKTAWGQGYGTDAIRLVADYAFRRLNLHKLNAGSYATNVRSIRAFTKAGFVVEGHRSQHFQSESEWVAHVWLGLLNDKG